ncbi:MAG: hypothetical protein Q7R62_03365 [bacterium]|nr:hypothetical protein [bacterium]
MRHKTLLQTTGFIFLIITILHIGRIAYSWNVTIGTFTLPLWVSWIAIIVAALLSYNSFRYAKRS